MTTNSSFSTQNCEKECRNIHDGIGRANDLVQILVRKNQFERREIREKYLAMYQEDLVQHFQKIHLSHQNNETYNILAFWMLEQYERDTLTAKNAFKDGEINYKALIEIYSGRKSSHILLIKQAYQNKFKRQLDHDILNSELSHPYQRILVALATSHKSHQADISQHIAKCDAKRLYETGEGKGRGSIEECVVLEIFSKRSIPQLRLTFSTYKHIYGHEYTKTLKGVYTEFEGALKIMVKCMYNSSNYYAKVLYASIKGPTIDKDTLTRVMISKAETDMDEIRSVFKKKYNMELRDAIYERVKNQDERDFFVALAKA